MRTGVPTLVQLAELYGVLPEDMAGSNHREQERHECREKRTSKS